MLLNEALLCGNQYATRLGLTFGRCYQCSLLRTLPNFKKIRRRNSSKSGLSQDALEEIGAAVDLRNPAKLYPKARRMKRQLIFHAGPTNSGKTYHAMKKFLGAETGIYCGPLRMLAAEIFHKTNREGVPCDMITGEERKYIGGELQRANHLSCTVEMCSTTDHYHVAVIDEIQMLRDEDRGWAWTRALLGVPADEVHLCGEPAAIKIVEKILQDTQDDLTVKEYSRLTPLKFLPRSVDSLQRIIPGDCVVAFSQRKIYNIRNQIESITGLKCSVIYGNLPPAIRLEQAKSFNESRGDADVLVASDAIGMGINLNIRRIIFHELSKFDGRSQTSLTPHHTKQIAGRAGRFGTEFETGYVTSFNNSDLNKLQTLLKSPNVDIQEAGISPTLQQLEVLSAHLPGSSLCQLLTVFEELVSLNRNYFLCDIERLKTIAKELEVIPLSLYQSYTFAQAPINYMRSEMVMSTLFLFAKMVLDNQDITKDVVARKIRWPPNPFPRTLHQLQHLEFMHEALDLYLWLSYRFETLFTERKAVKQMQVRLEKILSRAVGCNMKYKKKDKQDRHFIEKKYRDRRRKPKRNS